MKEAKGSFQAKLGLKGTSSSLEKNAIMLQNYFASRSSCDTAALQRRSCNLALLQLSVCHWVFSSCFQSSHRLKYLSKL